MRKMINFWKALVPVFAAAIIVLSMAGCGDRGKPNSEHPGGEHPTDEKPSTEHPSGEHPN